MSAHGQRPIILHADQEHSGLRLAVFAALFAGLLLGFWVVLQLLDAFAPPAVRDYRIVLSCLGAFPPALLLIWGLERLLKRVWHSGLSLELNPRGIVVHDRRGKGSRETTQTAAPSSPAAGTWNLEPDIRWDGKLSQINWTFRLGGYPRAGRERRLPAKWLCLATELNQDGTRLNVYTFMPPDEAQAWVERSELAFIRLNPADIYERSARSRFGPPSRPTIPNQVLHSKDGRYWLAEQRRWEYGVELTPADFAILMERVQAAGAELRTLTMK